MGTLVYASITTDGRTQVTIKCVGLYKRRVRKKHIVFISRSAEGPLFSAQPPADRFNYLIQSRKLERTGKPERRNGYGREYGDTPFGKKEIKETTKSRIPRRMSNCAEISSHFRRINHFRYWRTLAFLRAEKSKMAPTLVGEGLRTACTSVTRVTRTTARLVGPVPLLFFASEPRLFNPIRQIGKRWR